MRIAQLIPIWVSEANRHEINAASIAHQASGSVTSIAIKISSSRVAAEQMIKIDDTATETNRSASVRVREPKTANSKLNVKNMERIATMAPKTANVPNSDGL